MPGMLVNQGETIMLEALVNKTAPQSLTLKLFTNDKTPAEGDAANAYTEATGNGYASVTLTPASWTATPGAPSQVEHPQVTFTFTGALGSVYGYFLVQAVSGLLVAAERFSDGPYVIVNNGDQIKITPRVTQD